MQSQVSSQACLQLKQHVHLGCNITSSHTVGAAQPTAFQEPLPLSLTLGTLTSLPVFLSTVTLWVLAPLVAQQDYFTWCE